jgi:hypothetical protein
MMIWPMVAGISTESLLLGRIVCLMLRCDLLGKDEAPSQAGALGDRSID